MNDFQTNTPCNLYIGIDFHKKTWQVHFRTDLFSGTPFSMEPDTDLLHHKVMKEFPEHQVSVVYECGCFGYWAYRNFLEFGWEC